MGCDQVGGKSALLPDRGLRRSSLECGGPRPGPRRTDSELRAVRRLINQAHNWTTSIDVMYPGGPPPAPARGHRYRAGLLRRQRIDETAPIFVTRTFALRTSSTPKTTIADIYRCLRLWFRGSVGLLRPELGGRV